MILRLRAMVGAIALVVALAVSAVAHGQTASPSGQAGNTPADKPAASVENLQSLAKTLEDPERRQQLISQIEALIAAQQASEQPAEADGLGARMISTLAAAADALGAPSEPCRTCSRMPADGSTPSRTTWPIRRRGSGSSISPFRWASFFLPGWPPNGPRAGC